METEHESLVHHRRLWRFMPKATHAFKFSAVLPICGMRESDVRVVILGFLLAGLGTVHSCAQTTHDPDIESKIVALENIAKLQARKAKDIKPWMQSWTMTLSRWIRKAECEPRLVSWRMCKAPTHCSTP
jgi:hypothetical protein